MSYPIQTAFNAGELSERLRGRVDIELYKRGLSYCENFVPTPQGSITKRGGTRHVAKLLSNTVRLLDFPTKDGNFVVELTDDTLRVFGPGGVQSITSTAEKFNDPGFDNPAAWTTGGPYSVVGGSALTMDSGGGTSSCYQAVSITVAGTYRFKSNVVFLSSSTYLGCKVGTSAGGAQVAHKTRSTTGEWTFEVTFGSTGTFYFYFYSSNRVTVQSDVSLTQLTGSTTIAAPWGQEIIADVQYVVDYGSDRMVIVHNTVAPRELYRNSSGNWNFGEITFTGAPASWTGTAYPDVVEMFQGRLWFAYRNEFWASKSGVLFTFTYGSTAEDAFNRKIQTKGVIRWMRGNRSLLVGTDVGEYTITSDGPIVTTYDCSVIPYGAFSSTNRQAVHLGDQAAYISRDRRKVRALEFDFQSNGWIVKELTFLAEHIPFNDAIKEIHYIRDPLTSLMLVLTSGLLGFCTYSRADEVVAWWRYTPASGGEVESACVTDGAYGSTVWLAVTRDTGTFLETFDLQEETSFFDCSFIAVPNASNEITGLSNFDGETFQVVLDGVQQADEVVSSGKITLNQAGVLAVVGYGYDAKFRTLARDLRAGRGRHAKVGVQLNNSALPKIDGTRPKKRSEIVNPPAAYVLRTGKYELAKIGWSDEDVIEVSQDLPYRTEVLSLFGVAAENEV